MLVLSIFSPVQEVMLNNLMVQQHEWCPVIFLSLRVKCVMPSVPSVEVYCLILSNCVTVLQVNV